MYALIISTNRRNKEPKKQGPRKNQETKQNQGQKIIKHQTQKITKGGVERPPHNYINNLKCVESQRPDDGHYRPKHVVF